MDPTKIDTIFPWEKLKDEIQNFLWVGIIIIGFTFETIGIAMLFTRLTGKDVKLV